MTRFDGRLARLDSRHDPPVHQQTNLEADLVVLPMIEDIRKGHHGCTMIGVNLERSRGNQRVGVHYVEKGRRSQCRRGRGEEVSRRLPICTNLILSNIRSLATDLVTIQTTSSVRKAHLATFFLGHTPRLPHHLGPSEFLQSLLAILTEQLILVPKGHDRDWFPR